MLYKFVSHELFKSFFSSIIIVWSSWTLSSILDNAFSIFMEEHLNFSKIICFTHRNVVLFLLVSSLTYLKENANLDALVGWLWGWWSSIDSFGVKALPLFLSFLTYIVIAGEEICVLTGVVWFFIYLWG